MNYLVYGTPKCAIGAIEEMLVDRFHSLSNPDIHRITRDEKRKSMGVEVADEILAIANDKPYFDKHIIVIEEFNLLTPEAQTKLLKLMEDSECVDIYASVTSDEVLNTIKSRCKVMRAECGYNTFLSLCEKEHALEYYFLTSGDLNEVNSVDDDLLKIFLSIKDALFDEPKKILNVLNLVTEKDKNAFSSLYSDYESSLIKYIGRLLTDRLERELIEEAPVNYNLLDSIKLCSIQRVDSGYTKNNFFSFVVNLINNLEV